MMVNTRSKRKKKGKEMDLRLASSSSRKRKLSRDHGIDIISNMPDCILQHILFFLSAKDVVRTSILSRRWQYLWTSLANIDLEDKTSWKIKNRAHRKMSENNFLEFVNRVIVLHDASVIRRLRLSLDFLPGEFSRLNLWISIALDHNVEELELLLPRRPQCEMPCSLFTCSSLIVLKIDAPVNLKPPPVTFLSRLMKLHLSHITFADDLSTQQLFSNCPVLDELKLVNCDWDNIKNVIISVPLLRNLTIIGDVDSGYFHGDRDGEYITGSHVKIAAANLADLKFSSYLDVDFEFIDLASLKTASLDLPYNDGIEEEVATRTVLRLFSRISNVECLTLSAVTIECLQTVKASLDHLPTFYSLTCLTVDEPIYGDYAVFLLQFLEKIPKLEYLELSKGCEEPLWVDEHITRRDEIMQQTAPSCFNSSLRTFAIKKFKMVLLERLMIEYVLKHAIVLESLCISCSENINKTELPNFRGRLKKIPRASASCNIKFSF